MTYLGPTYNAWGVLASVLIAAFASYVALELAQRERSPDRAEAIGWLVGGAVVMGTGIWSMHFVGMLAFSLPIALGYTHGLTALSWLAAVAASGVALWLAGRGELSGRRLAGGALAMGGAICAMHYTGMAALDMSPPIVWDPALVVASAAIAVAASAAALRIFFWLRRVGGRRGRLYQVAAACVMGLAISGMHYTGMAAANFPASSVCRSAGALGGPGLGQLVTTASLLLLTLGLITAVLNTRMQRRSRTIEQSLTAANVELQSRFQAVFEYAPSGFLLFNRQRGIAHCNAAAVKLFGAADRAALVGRSPWQPPLSPAVQADGRDGNAALLALLRRRAETGESAQEVEWRFSRIDGTPFEACVSIVALDSNEEPEFCALIEDVTARKQAEAALMQARDAAQAASRAKSSFLANMSHELRTPMNAIIGMTRLALDDGLPPKQHDYVQKAHVAARNLLQILNDVLDVSKIEAGHLELETIDFDLEAVIGETVDVLGLKAEEKGLELLFSAPPDLPPRLVGDPSRLRQALVNLGSNAIKFTDRGEVTLGLEVQSQDAHSVEVHGWVRDTGIGMSAEQVERAFRPFMQGDSSTTRRFGGTGLGLTIVSQLIGKMGGRLWADSEPGRGSTFHFNARFGRSAKSSAPSAHWAGDVRGQHALLVDDNAAALDVLGRMFENLGIAVDRAASGDAALRLLDADPQSYRWIALDWKMPGMDGVSCARHIVERYPQAQACILLVTAFSRDDALRAAAGLPLAGVLEKPVTPSSLLRCLTQADAVARPAEGAAPPRAELERLVGARILLVEDNPVNRELATELLRRAGMNVVVAEDGEQALRRLREGGPFDGVLMDCQMPVMDGYTATTRLRENPAWRDLPVIAMTASAFAADRQRALDSGMNAHITKPLDIDVMLQTMAQWIAVATPGLIKASRGEGPIDTAAGLASCAGDAMLYRRLLDSFRRNQADLEQRRVAGLGSSDDELRRRLHDLMGLAGTIGAKSLAQCARALHVALAAGEEAEVDNVRSRLATELRATLQAIDDLLPADGPRR